MNEPTSDDSQPLDPTAPVWADPTAPMPAPPPQDPPATPPPVSNPYAQQPPAQPYPAYGQQPAQPYPAYGQQPYPGGPPAETNASAIVLTVVSALAMLGTCFIGIPSLVFGIMALTSNRTDPVGSRKKARTGWIIFAINAAVVVALGVILGIVLFAMNGSRPNTDIGY